MFTFLLCFRSRGLHVKQSVESSSGRYSECLKNSSVDAVIIGIVIAVILSKVIKARCCSLLQSLHHFLIVGWIGLSEYYTRI